MTLADAAEGDVVRIGGMLFRCTMWLPPHCGMRPWSEEKGDVGGLGALVRIADTRIEEVVHRARKGSEKGKCESVDPMRGWRGEFKLEAG